MRDSYEDSPAGTRDAGLRRLGRLTWRTTQLGALATVGFAIVFARTAPAPAANVQTVPPTTQAPAATAAATHAPSQHSKKPRVTASTHPATKPAATPSGGQQATQAAQPTPQPTAQAPAPSPKPTLAPPTTAPTAAPSTSAPAPTATSTTHSGA
jgi:hypothetical protein